MSRKSNKRFKWTIPFAVLSVTCASVGLIAGLSGCKPHVHAYEWKYEEGGNAHWKECPKDGAIEEGSRGEHVFIAGVCDDCGASENSATKKYGTASGTVKLHKNGGYETDFSDVTLDMGDDVHPELNRTTGEFKIENVEAGKSHKLKISKPGYQTYEVTVQVEENKNSVIGGSRGAVLEYEVFGSLAGWDTELHDFSHVNDADPYIRFKEHEGNESLSVISKDSYNNVAATFRIKFQNSTHGWGLHGLALKFEDGKHVIVRFQTDAIQFKNEEWGDDNVFVKSNSLLGDDLGLNQWGEKTLHSLTSDEMNKIKGDGLDLTVVLKDGKLLVLFNGKFITEYQLPEGYAEKKAQVAYYAYDAASNAIFNYKITEATETALEINVEKPDDGAECTVTAVPQKDKYNFGEQIELTFSAPAGYKLNAITVNGEDKYNSVEDGRLTVVADRETVEVNAVFVKEQPIALELTVKGKKLGATAVLAQNTQVRFSGIDTPFTVDAQGKIHGSAVIKGRYTVAVEGYLSKEITFDENLTEITFEYDTFRSGMSWAPFDNSQQNDNKILGFTNNCGFIFTNESYTGDVAASVYLKGAGFTQGDLGLAFRFNDANGMSHLVAVRMEGTAKIQFYGDGDNIWAGDTGLSHAVGTSWHDLIWFSGDNADANAAEYLKAYNEGTLKLTVLRKGGTFYVFLNDSYIGQKTFGSADVNYTNARVEAGFCVFGANMGAKSWDFAITDKASEFPSLNVTITDGTAENAGGTISVSPASVKLGETVTITATPDGTHILDKIVVSGGVTLTPQANGTYTFVATKSAYTITATFAERPLNEAEAAVSGIGAGNTALTIANGTAVKFTPAVGSATTLTVTNGTVKGSLLPAEYTVTIDGYHSIKATVGADGTFQNLAAGLKFEKIILTYNIINESESNMREAGFLGNVADDSAVASTGKITANGAGSIYEWTADDFDDVAMSVTVKKQSGIQGLVLKFYGVNIDNRSQNDVRVRIEGVGDSSAKIQWHGGSWFWGTHNAVDAWDFMADGGEDYAVPMSAAMYAKYTGEGLTLTLARKNGIAYVLADGEVLAAQVLDERFAGQKVRMAYYAISVAEGYEVPVEITTDVDALLADKTDANGVMGVLGKWTVTENTLAVTGNGYAEFAPAASGTRESLTVTLANNLSTAGKKAQGITYRFADGKWISIRMETSSEETYIQYADDLLLPKSGGSLTGWGKVADFDASRLESGVQLQMVRDGKDIYILLGGEVIGKRTLEDKYAAMEGVIAATLERGTGTAFAYEYKSGADVVIPAEPTV